MTDSVETVALVTGGGSGIGRATAIALARQGSRVIVGDVDPRGGEETVEQIVAEGGRAFSGVCDVAELSQVEALVARGIETYGRLDQAVNNAGIQGDLAPTAECSKANWDRTLAVNLTGIWHCMKCEIPEMLRNDGGAIVNVASNFGLVGNAGMPAYSASKHGIIGLTKTAALEYATQGVRVNAVCPGPVATPMVDKILAAQPELADEIIDGIVAREPIGRMGRAEEIAEAIAWMCGKPASFVTGSVLPVDGGFVAQ